MNLTTESLNLTLSRRYPVSTAPDGNPIVHVGTDTVEVLSHDANFLWKNIPGNVEGMPMEQTVPLTCRAGDAVILARSGAAHVDRKPYHDAPCKSEIHRMGIVQFVSYPQHSSTTFRPCGIGVDRSQVLRDYRVPLEQMKLDRLPSVVSLQPETVRTLLPYLERLFGGFCGEVRDGWGTETITPAFQHPCYGGYLSNGVSLGLLMLVSTIPMTAKRVLAERMVQWGLDIGGAFYDKRVNTSNGGHMQGRKALVILAGYLLGIDDMRNPDKVTPHWQETIGYETLERTWWFGGWRHIWHPFGYGSGWFVTTPPSQWTDDRVDSNGNTVRGQKFRMSYMNQVLGSQVGTALAMRLMGLQREMGSAFIGMVAQWMDGPPAGAMADLARAGMTFPWGTDYTVGPGAGICADAWRSVGGMVLP